MTEIIALEPRLRLLTAATPGLGLELARAEPPALILLDLQLPEMSGLALLELLRQEPALAKVPVVAVTSQGSERDIAIGTAAGFDDYIVKPFAVNRLLATVARLLGRPGV